MVAVMDERIDVELDDVRISCAIGGVVDGPPLVFIHGGAGDGSTWGEIAAAFEAEYRIYRPDLRGHGRSGWPSTYSYELLGADVIGVAETLGLADVTVVGHSLGGRAGLQAALRRPRWLRRLVVEDTMLDREPVDLPPLGKRPEGATYDWDGIMPPLRRQVADPDPRWWSELPFVATPTLFLAGDAQRKTTTLAADAVKIMPDARLKVMNTGHCVHCDKPSEFVDELREFFAARPLA